MLQSILFQTSELACLSWLVFAENKAKIESLWRIVFSFAEGDCAMVLVLNPQENCISAKGQTLVLLWRES